MGGNDEQYQVYFSEIQLKNIRCFKDSGIIPFNKDGKVCPWNIVLGNNGSGKTTILKSLTFVWNKDNFKARTIEQFLRNDNLEGSINIQYNKSRLGSDSSINEIANIVLNKNGAANGPNITYPYIIYPMMPLFAYGASRIIGEGSLSKSKSDSTIESLFNDNFQLINAEEWLLQTDYMERASSKKNGTNKTQKVIDLLLELFQDEVTDIKIDVEESPRVLFKTQFGWVRLHDLSLGYKSLIAWMVDLASRMMERYPYPEFKNPLEQPAIVLVDEIDLHLHPSFQRRLVGWLTGIFKQTQFIVTAHSPIVAQSGAHTNIILLTRDGDNVKVSQNPVDIRQWRVDQILTSDLFGLPSALSEETESKMATRRNILAKPKLTSADKKQLNSLNQELEKMPIGDTQSEIEGFAVMKEFARQLSAKKQRGEI